MVFELNVAYSGSEQTLLAYVKAIVIKNASFFVDFIFCKMTRWRH